MFLKYSDVTWQWLRITDENFRFLRIADVITRYVYSLYQADSFAVGDRFNFSMTGVIKDAASSSDSIRLSYSTRLLESVVPLERFSVRFASRGMDVVPAVDVVRVTFASPFSEAVLSSDRVTTSFVLRLFDAVGLNESFFFGGVFNVDINNIVTTSDRVMTSDLGDSNDEAVVSEFVRVGIRHMIDFYLGGFAMGSVVFGGRLR